jgi:hypothetical protein
VPEKGSSIGSVRFWDGLYRERGTEGVSWYQPAPETSLELIAALDVPSTAAVIDVGGGASLLVDALLERGFADVTLLDLSREALDAVALRLPSAAGAHLERADVLEWCPSRRYDVWHDRAVFHFLVHEQDRRRYLDVLRAATAPCAVVVLGTFAPDAPETCSGLPVVRYSVNALAAALGDEFQIAEVRREEHMTPRGMLQPFTWVAGRLRDRALPTL